MPKRATPEDRPEILLDASLPTPLYKQLYGRLRGAILAGHLLRGERLPSTRALASQLGISRGTAALAYEQLLLEGYLESRVGHGTIVSRHVPTMLAHESGEHSPAILGDTLTKPATRFAAHVRPLETIPNPNRVEGTDAEAFRVGQPALNLFPYELWARLVARRARQSLCTYAYDQSRAGYLPLREAIAAHIGISRGVRCTPEQVILTAGAQGALDLAARTLLDPGETAWVEDPGYFGARGALLLSRAHLVPVPIDKEGLDVAAGRRRGPGVRLISTTPSHQFPTGVTMSFGRRLELLELARQADAWILEDDYDSEYSFSGRPLEALQALDQAGRVIYIGTFGKVLFPNLRLGYLVAPSELIEPLLTTHRFINVHVPILEQMALADFMHEGHYARHLRRMRQCYWQRRDCLCHELRVHLGGLLDVYVPEAGMQLVGWLPAGKDDRRAAALAAAAGIKVVPISSYSLEPLVRGGLHLGFAGTNNEDIRRGVRRLAKALRDL